MLETLTPLAPLPREVYTARMTELKAELRELQQEAREVGLPVLVILSGWDTAGKGDALRQATEILDPRGFVIHAFERPGPREAKHWMRRYALRVPARGQFAFFERSWYLRVFQGRVEKTVRKKDWKRGFREIEAHERMIAHDGTLILKFWLHITQEEQRARLAAAQDDPFWQFSVTDREWNRHHRYDEYLPALGDMLGRTNFPFAPWILVDAADKRARRVFFLEQLTARLRQSIGRRRRKLPVADFGAEARGKPVKSAGDSRLEDTDLSRSIPEEKYADVVKDAQIRLGRLQREAYGLRIPSVIVYEGWDAAGKGGNIRRLTATLDPRMYRVVPIAKPSPEELAQHYLWRFWRPLPENGHMTIYDRSWYGRVLVERIEGFCTEADWRRAYGEIRSFEESLVREGAVLVKFWIHISPEEQLRRFEARKADPLKQWKLNDEDWRNRAKWDVYHEAVNDMLHETSTRKAPWTVIAGEDKRHARVQAINAVADALERAIRKARARVK